jgi:hypothetical protein
LKGTRELIEDAIETLRRKLPPAPPSVQELVQQETRAKMLAVEALRLNEIKKRNKPSTPSSKKEGVVGKA